MNTKQIEKAMSNGEKSPKLSHAMLVALAESADHPSVFLCSRQTLGALRRRKLTEIIPGDKPGDRGIEVLTEEAITIGREYLASLLTCGSTPQKKRP